MHLTNDVNQKEYFPSTFKKAVCGAIMSSQSVTMLIPIFSTQFNMAERAREIANNIICLQIVIGVNRDKCSST